MSIQDSRSLTNAFVQGFHDQFSQLAEATWKKEEIHTFLEEYGPSVKKIAEGILTTASFKKQYDSARAVANAGIRLATKYFVSLKEHETSEDAENQSQAVTENARKKRAKNNHILSTSIATEEVKALDTATEILFDTNGDSWEAVATSILEYCSEGLGTAIFKAKDIVTGLVDVRDGIQSILRVRKIKNADEAAIALLDDLQREDEEKELKLLTKATKKRKTPELSAMQKNPSLSKKRKLKKEETEKAKQAIKKHTKKAIEQVHSSSEEKEYS